MLDFEKGIVNYGNPYLLKSTMDRASSGEHITVGFIGGSITQGSLSSSPETCYAYLVYRWWAERFENVTYVNTGIGGTTSQFGVARAEEDLLTHNPDVVFIEFSVNDAPTELFKETYEGLVRVILSSGAAVVLIHNVCYDTGLSAEDIHVAVGRHYDLPCVSIRSTVYNEILAGHIQNRQITPDDLHPNDEGHALLAKAVTYLLDQVYETPKNMQLPGALPAPITANQYAHCIRYQNYNSHPVLNGFLPDDTPQTHITQMFRRGYTAQKTDDSITFHIESTGIAVQYRKSVKKPAPIARIIIDGDEEHAHILDANFQEDWGDCLHIDTILTHGELKLRKVEIRIIQTQENDTVPFYLVSVIGSN